MFNFLACLKTGAPTFANTPVSNLMKSYIQMYRAFFECANKICDINKKAPQIASQG